MPGDFEIIAAHGGLCPLCGHYIAISKSRLKPLLVPTPPCPDLCTFYAERGAWLIHAQYARVHGRRWAHSRCVDKLDRDHSSEQQVGLASEWRAELIRMRRAAERLSDRPRGRQQQAKRMSDALALALVDSLDEPALERLVAKLGPRLVDALADRLSERQRDGWLDARGAAEYLGLSVTALHKRTAARSLPFTQDAAGGKLWFLRSELDGWRRDGR